MNTTAVVRDYLLYFVMPLWLVAGAADWWCHHRSDIERTSGTPESILHLMLLAEGGVAVLAGVFLRINALVLAVMILAFVAHEITSYADLRYAFGRREVAPIEQKVHDYLAIVPLLALSFVLVLNWGQFLALAGLGPEPADFSVVLNPDQLPRTYVVTLLGAIVLFEILPYGEELWRCLDRRSRDLPRRQPVLFPGP